VLFGRGQNALEADHQEITENGLGSPAHVILFKTTDGVAKVARQAQKQGVRRLVFAHIGRPTIRAL